jgi:adenylate cyclase
VERRLAAVLGADIKGYSLLMGAGEEDTHRRVGTALARLSRHIERFSGYVFSFSGDGVMAEFRSAVDAVKCALAAQRTAAQQNARVALSRRIEFRVGINSGDIVSQDGRIGGDAGKHSRAPRTSCRTRLHLPVAGSP